MNAYSYTVNYYILQEKKPVKATLAQWEKWRIEARGERYVSDSQVGTVGVLTLFWGFDASPENTTSMPMLFETLVFDGEYSSHGEKYSTYESALQGHSRICRKIHTEIEEKTCEYC